MAAPAAYRHTTRDLHDGDLFLQVELLRETMATPGWTLVLDAIGAHEKRMLAQLLNESTKVEEIPRLRGLVDGLRSMREAAESILKLGEEREEQARRAAAQENAHV